MAFDLYLDTSALVKLYVAELETAALNKFVKRHSPPLPYSSLHELEITHAIERRRRDGHLTTSEANSISAALERDLGAGVLVRPESDWPGTFARAIHLVRQHRGLRSLDSLHVGGALEAGCSWFVTFDEKQASAASAEGLKLWPK